MDMGVAEHANISQIAQRGLHSHKTLGKVLFYDHSPYALELLIQSCCSLTNDEVLL